MLALTITPNFLREEMLIKNPTPRQDCLALTATIMTPEYLALNLRQKTFVVHYVDSGLSDGVYDAVAALRIAYGPDIKRADIRAYQILRNKKVKKVLDLHFRRSGLESILVDLKRAARQSVRLKLGLTPATVKALAAFEAYISESANVKQ
jgi:hypothetical protein